MSDPLPVALRVRRLRPGARLPARATAGASGYDLYACIEAPVEVGPDPVRIGTGIALAIEEGYDVQIRPRSGLAAKGVLATLGTIDSDYRGELMVTLFTIGARGPHTVQDGDRIAQLIVSRLAAVEVVEVTELDATERGSGGHGSTGA